LGIATGVAHGVIRTTIAKPNRTDRRTAWRICTSSMRRLRHSGERSVTTSVPWPG